MAYTAYGGSYAPEEKETSKTTTTSNNTSTTTSTSNSNLLYKGMSGDSVRKLQQRLTRYGYDLGAIDGIFGPKTEAAVKAYQKDKGITVDGIVGDETRSTYEERQDVVNNAISNATGENNTGSNSVTGENSGTQAGKINAYIDNALVNVKKVLPDADRYTGNYMPTPAKKKVDNKPIVQAPTFTAPTVTTPEQKSYTPFASAQTYSAPALQNPQQYNAPNINVPQDMQAPAAKEYTRVVGESAMSVENVATQTQDIINQYKQGTVDQQAVLVQQLDTMIQAIDAMEEQVIGTIQSQLSADDPAMRQAFQILKEEFAQQKDEVIQELNAKGILQSGQYAKTLLEMNKGYMTAESNILAQRFGDLQNQLLSAMTNIGQMRINTMAGNYANVNELMSNANNMMANLGMEGIGAQQNQQQINQQNQQFYDQLNTGMQYNYDQMNANQRLSYDQLLSANKFNYDQLNSGNQLAHNQLRADTQLNYDKLNSGNQQFYDQLNSGMQYNYDQMNADVQRFYDQLRNNTQFNYDQLNANTGMGYAQMQQQGDIASMQNFTNQRGQAFNLLSELYGKDVQQQIANMQNKTTQDSIFADMQKAQWQYGVQPDTNYGGGYSTAQMREADAMLKLQEQARADANFNNALVLIPTLQQQLKKKEITTQDALTQINAMPFSQIIKDYMIAVLGLRAQETNTNVIKDSNSDSTGNTDTSILNSFTRQLEQNTQQTNELLTGLFNKDTFTPIINTTNDLLKDLFKRR